MRLSNVIDELKIIRNQLLRDVNEDNKYGAHQAHVSHCAHMKMASNLVKENKQTINALVTFSYSPTPLKKPHYLSTVTSHLSTHPF